MQAGFDRARGRIVVSMDGDLQNDPRDIPLLVAKLDEGYDLVAGYRMRRQDRIVTRKIPSWVANRIIIWLTGVRIRDNGCSLKAYRRDLLDQLHLYSDMHRFLPALAAATANARIAEVPVRHHARRFGASKYGLSRIAKLLADLLTIKMIATFRESPLAMFGLGTLASIVFAGGFIAAWLLSSIPNAYVFPGSALLCIALAVFLTVLGLMPDEALQAVRAEAERLGVALDWMQTNHEGAFVDAVQALKGRADGALVNAAALTQTSLAIRDAFPAVKVPFVQGPLPNIVAWGGGRRVARPRARAGGRCEGRRSGSAFNG